MASLPRAAVVVEDRYSSLFKLEHTKPGFVTELLAALTVRYPPCLSTSVRPALSPRSGPTASSVPRSLTTKPKP